jgi:hypothetical protein
MCTIIVLLLFQNILNTSSCEQELTYRVCVYVINDAVSKTNYIMSDDWTMVNNELGRIWKEAVVT